MRALARIPTVGELSLRRCWTVLAALVVGGLFLPRPLAASTEAVHTEYPSVLKSGGMYRMWYSAYGNDESGADAWRIHYATSTDGVHWSRHGVVLDRGAAGSWEQSGVAFPSVIQHGGQYMMWYGGQVQGKYSIGLATSKDGIEWTRSPANPLLVAEPERHRWEGMSVLDPAVIYDSGERRFMMWYNAIGSGYAHGLATSRDGVRWTKHTANPVLTGSTRHGDWDETGLYTLAVLKDGRTYRMWYAVGLNGRGASIGTATSGDGVRWTRSPANPFSIGPITADDAWNAFGDFFYGMHVIRDGAVLKMWTNAISGANRPHGSIVYATSADGVTWWKGSENPVVCPTGWPGSL